MPFQRGQPRPEGAGRKPGTGNRATVTAILAGLKCDPIAGLAEIAMDTKVKTEIRARCYAELAKYVWPQKRAIEARFVDDEGHDRELMSLEQVRAFMESVPDPV